MSSGTVKNTSSGGSAAAISKLLPRITLLGKGKVSLLSTGGTAMLHNVVHMSS